jgi:hypothetical protein
MLKNNIDKEFDYSTVKNIVLKSLERIVKEQALEKRSNVPDDAIFDYEGIDDKLNNVNLYAPPITPLLKLKIRNTMEYLNWRLLILK